ncbi:MAG: bifunctional phosphoribosylaminoimidazolecarboxamide formyltransferase/IMP cyclohydrolase PurH [Actinobacteria bacterium]|nr:bifunctional phosphoribosylaminoimidazolecarboxamide formyltransferase/IMP cyclohydrolase PurH [Actinomycetota bacterium]
MLEEKWALLSVSNKSGVIDLAKLLLKHNYRILASDGTHSYLESHSIPATRIAEFTNAEEIFDGRVKTLHPLIHGAILFDRENPAHLTEAERRGIKSIEVVVVNLYSEEQFDIGGPALIRAAAKNHRSVTVLTDPSQYAGFEAALSQGTLELIRYDLAKSALEATARYDLSILRSMSTPLRYGENPHQDGSVAGARGVAGVTLIQGAQLSFNNYLDIDCATLIASDHSLRTTVIVKHGAPCGVASDNDPHKSFLKALESDSISAFGGVIATNFEVDEKLANEIISGFYEVLVAPSYSSAALSLLAQRKKMRVLVLEKRESQTLSMREINGGFLFQSFDAIESSSTWKIVSGAIADEKSRADLEFAWRCVARTRSNAIVIAKNLATVGIGMGEVSRVAAAKNALARAGDKARSAVAASDGFFPFPDGLEILAQAGVKAIIAPQGSIRDEEIITAAKRLGITLYFAANRHFSHN